MAPVEGTPPLACHQTDLSRFHKLAHIDSKFDGHFVQVKRIHRALHGQVGQYLWHLDGEVVPTAVAIKKMPQRRVFINSGRETNDRKAAWEKTSKTSDAEPVAEDPLTELGVLRYLSKLAYAPPLFPKFYGAFVQDDHVHQVSEIIEGGELFRHVSSKHFFISEDRAQHYMWQLLQAIAFLHSHRIAHCDISLENILVNFRHDAPHGRLKLIDFAMAVTSHTLETDEELRYFRKAGKFGYNGPECIRSTNLYPLVHVPEHAKAGDIVFCPIYDGDAGANGKLGEVMLPPDVESMEPGSLGRAEVVGYRPARSDIWAAGVCLYLMAWRAPPFKLAVLSDEGFARIYEDGFDDHATGFPEPLTPLPPLALQVLNHMLNPNPSARLSAEELMNCEWFEDQAGVAMASEESAKVSTLDTIRDFFRTKSRSRESLTESSGRSFLGTAAATPKESCFAGIARLLGCGEGLTESVFRTSRNSCS
mmetsp:Transcript_42924/g.100807  ORF Transcript_42924/g.100807 Transcript_42924/m.100807 type:complete len:477 (-) Transcript_42924:331-1761(-)